VTASASAIRHDRSTPEKLRVFLNDNLVFARRGMQDRNVIQTVRPRPQA
jgi:hypothetical protein